MKTIGIIGGLGPQTTAKFYEELIAISYDRNKKTRPSIIIASVPVPYELEKNFIINNKDIQNYVPLLIHEAQRLEKAGAEFIVMPCNSLHVLIEDIRKSVKIPVLSIIDETIRFLKNNNFQHVAIISTLATVKNKLYEKSCEQAFITYERPTSQQQKILGNIIQNCLSNKQEQDSILLEEIIDSFSNKKIHGIVLACTDLQLLQSKHSLLPIIDTMKIFAQATIEYALTPVSKNIQKTEA